MQTVHILDRVLAVATLTLLGILPLGCSAAPEAGSVEDAPAHALEESAQEDAPVEDVIASGEVARPDHVTALVRPGQLNFAAPSVLEYHEVSRAPDRSLPYGLYVSTGHIERLARQFSSQRHLITIDDGYRSAFDLVLPILRAREIRAVVGVINEATRDSGTSDARESHLSSAELKALALAGWNIAFHATSVAEHELAYPRMVEILRSGDITSAARSPSSIAITDRRARAYLVDAVGFDDDSVGDLLGRLRSSREEVVTAVVAGTWVDDAAADALARILGLGRTRLAALAGIRRTAVDTFVYPHGRDNHLVRLAARRAGFTRGYAGDGDPRNAFDKPRIFMADTSSIP